MIAKPSHVLFAKVGHALTLFPHEMVRFLFRPRALATMPPRDAVCLLAVLLAGAEASRRSGAAHGVPLL
jgi:hypothetical protein